MFDIDGNISSVEDFSKIPQSAIFSSRVFVKSFKYRLKKCTLESFELTPCTLYAGCGPWGCIFIYLCSALLIYFEISCFLRLISKKISRAEHRHRNMHATPQPRSQGLSLGRMGKTLEAAGHVTLKKFDASWGVG